MLLYDFVVDTHYSLWNFHRSTICSRFWCMMWSKYCKMFLVHKTWLSTTWAYSTMICIQLMIWKWIVGVSRLFVVYCKLVVYGWIVDGMNCMKNWSSSVKLFRNRSPYFSFRMYGMECESWYWIVFEFWVKVRFDVNNDFLIIYVNRSDGELELIVDSPHKWTRIQTMMNHG